MTDVACQLKADWKKLTFQTLSHNMQNKMKSYLFCINVFFCFFTADYMWGLFPDVVMVIISEVAVDVVKHAFITKFNDISADVKTHSQFLMRLLIS